MVPLGVNALPSLENSPNHTRSQGRENLVRQKGHSWVRKTVLSVPVGAGTSLSLEVVLPPHHPTTPASIRHRNEGHVYMGSAPHFCSGSGREM